MRYDIFIYKCLLRIPSISKLNEPRNILWDCRCGGRSVIIKKDRWGLNLLCCKCFIIWIKPSLGYSYRRKDREKNLTKARRAHA